MAFLPEMELTRSLQFSAGDRLLPYVVTDSTFSNSDTVFFGLSAANTDNVDHVEITETGGGFTIAFEDGFGGGDQDFDDVVLSLDLQPHCQLRSNCCRSSGQHHGGGP